MAIGSLATFENYYKLRLTGLKRLESKSTPIKVQIAKNLENEAAIRTASGSIVAARLREEAIKRYRSIPRSERVNHAVDAQLIKMQGSLSESRKKSLDSMTPVETPGVNISHSSKRLAMQ